MSPWLPTLSVIFLTAIALSWASSPPITAIGRRLWIAGLLVVGSISIAGSVWQARPAIDEALAVAGTTTLPQASHRESKDAGELTKEVEALRERIRRLETQKEARVIPHDAAEHLAEYLKQFGSRHVVVSCIPDNIEAYRYANQLVNVLRAAEWNAHGPEVTNIFGDVRAPGVNIYVNPDDHSDTVKLLLDGFAKFNIPYQSKVTPAQAIPDTETVELFVGQQWSEKVSTGGG